MSTLDRPFINDYSGCCFCSDSKSEGNSTVDFFQQKENAFLNINADQEGKEEVDTLLSDALNNLTFKERQTQQERVHGVDEKISEEATFVESHLKELDENLNLIKAGSTYEVAELMDKEYVSARSFRLMFLRAKRYDSKGAADQILRFFETKQKLFGNDKLVKDITLDDLDEDDLVCLRSGFFQIVGRDRVDRLIVLELPGLRKAKTLLNELRSRYYISMCSVEGERNQLRGAVGIAWTIGEYREKEAGNIESVQMSTTLPIQSNAIHFCTDEISKYIMIKMLVKAMSPDFRARFQPHFGSHLECSYKLSTYGISAEMLPFAFGTNQAILDFHENWLQSRRSLERSRSRISPVVSPVNAPITEPSAVDVLFVGGMKCNNHANERLRALVKALLPAYLEGPKQRKVIVDGLIGDIAKARGRFLQKKSGHDTWEELDLDQSRVKVMQMFRNLGRQPTNVSGPSGTPITDEPRADDVLFGDRNRSRGSHLLQQLINDRSKEYDTLDRGQKKGVVEAIMKEIKDQGGRFLQELPESRGWLEVSHDEVRKRIAKYFRNKRRKR